VFLQNPSAFNEALILDIRRSRKTQNLVVSGIFLNPLCCYCSNEGTCAQYKEPFSQCTTVPAYRAASLSIASSLTARPIAPIQRVKSPPETQASNTKEATSNTNSRPPGTRTPLRRTGSIHSRGPRPQVATLIQDAENLASRSSEGRIGPVPTCKDAAVVNTRSGKKPGDTPMASSESVRGLRSKKVDVVKTTQKP
jgi:hypothetical protein